MHRKLLIASLVLAAIARSPGAGAEPPTEPPKGVPGIAPELKRRPPLMREGGFITRAAGALRTNKDRTEWTFVPTALDASGLEREFVLLPNETLGDAIRSADLSPSPISFEATGEVFIYHGKNYVLLSMMTPVVEVAAPIPVAPATGPPTAPTAKPVASKPTPQDEEAVAADLERRLAERIGSLPKSPTTAAPAAPTEPSASRESGVSNRAPRRASSPETRLQSRRGHVMRDASTGGWRFVFDGQLPDGGEPSMPLLPCLVLERVEQLVRQSDMQTALVVSGGTTSFEGRTYLLPTSFRVARGGKGINP